MRKSNIRRFILGSAGLSLAMIGGQAAAQDAEETEDETVRLDTVTVQSLKRGAQDLSKVSATINVIGGEDLLSREIRNPEDLRTAVSGVYIDEGSSSPRVSIRGVGFDNFQVQAENGVTLYMDGVVIQRNQALLGAFNDLAQVEVLKGPQGSAFGRNATGGAINLISNKPTDGFSGNISALVGSFDRTKLGGVLNYGGDQFGIRVSGFIDQDDGYVTNLVTGSDNLNGNDAVVGRIALSFDPTENLSIDYSLSYSDSEQTGAAQDHSNATSSATAAGIGQLIGLTPLLPGGPFAGLTDDNYEIAVRFDPLTTRETTIHALTGELDLGWATLKSITGVIDFESEWINDVGLPSAFAEGLVGTTADDGFKVESEQFSQEFLLNGSTDKLDWVVGAYYLTEEATDNTPIDFNLGAISPPPFNLPVGTQIIIDNGQELTSTAIFADGQYTVSDRVRLNAGLRYTEDEKEAFGQAQQIVIPGPVAFPALSLDGISAQSEEVTWQAGIEFDVSDDLFSYLRVARGYKAGGINNNDGIQYEPESLISYEVGLKGSLSDSFDFSVAAFLSEYEDIQLFAGDLETAVATIVNAAEATIAGADFEANWRASDNISFDAQLTWLPEAEYDRFEAIDGATGLLTDLSGGRLTRSPEYSGVFGANATATLSDRLDFSGRAEVYVTSEIDFSQYAIVRGDALTQDGYELVNLNATLTWDDTFDFRVYARNLTDEFYLSTITEGVAGFQYGGFGRPQEFGAELRWRF